MLTIIAGILLTIPMLVLITLLLLVVAIKASYWIKKIISYRRLRRLRYED